MQRLSGTPRGSSALRVLARGSLLAWAGFWTWFVLAVTTSEGWGSAPYAALFLVPIIGLSALSWARPRWGGPALTGASIIAAALLPGASARLLLALPAALVGVAIYLTRPEAQG